MGRWSTGVFTTDSAIRLELSYLIKHNFIEKGERISGSLSWTDGSSVRYYSDYSSNSPYIILGYTVTIKSSGEKYDYDYKIYLETIPSNLGKGEVLYFICPQSGRRSRILYRCYGSHTWKSREAYQNRIYYQTQLDPKSVRPFKHLFNDRKIEELYKKKRKSHYRGKPTRIMKKIDELERKSHVALSYYDRFERLMSKMK